MEAHRAFGVFCLCLLCTLCAHSFYEAPKHWDLMPPTDYLIENAPIFEGKTLYVDGIVSEAKRESGFWIFYISPVNEIFGILKVNANGRMDGIEKGTGVNVYGTVVNGVLEAEEVRVAKDPLYIEVLLNAAGFFAFVLYSLQEWRQ